VSVLREVAAAVGLAEGEAGVRDVLAAVARLEPVPTRALSRATGLPVPIVAAVCGELRTRGLLARERPTRLSARGREDDREDVIRERLRVYHDQTAPLLDHYAELALP